MTRATSLAVLVAVLATGIACSGTRSGAQRPSPAPNFNYITDEQLKSAMWQLAAGVNGLQAIFGDREPVTASEHSDVIRILDQMIAAVDELGPEGVATNHARITNNLGRFREKLEIARSSAEMIPPRYYLVGNVSGTCLACHATD
jgi:hypothetical protein